jgi:outer membrane lipoprotein-sorting protein
MFPILIRLLTASLVACASDPSIKKSTTESLPDVATQSESAVAESQTMAKKPAKKTESKKAAVKADAGTPKKTEKTDEDLINVENKYSQAKSVSMDVKKSQILSLLERTDVSEGRFYLSGKEKLRLEFDKPVKTVTVLNGKEFWVIEYPPKDVEDKIRVLKSTLGEKSQSQVLVTALLGRGRIHDHFKLDSKKKKDGNIIFKLKALGSMDEVKNLELTVNEESRLITEVSYEDELENKTRLEFTNVEFDGSVPEKLFTYAIPKGAEVNNL